MRKRPLHLFLAALVFLYFPTEMIWRWFRHQPVTALDVFISVALPLLLMVGLIRVTKVGWYTLFGVIGLWGIYDLYDYYNSQGAGAQMLVHLAIYFSSLAYFINPRVRHLYFDPKLRWWRTKPRYETHAPLMMRAQDQWHYPVLRNISDGGCFIETPHLLEVNAPISVAIPLPVPLAVSVIKAEGEVRWVSRNPLRFGMGVQFKAPEPAHVKALRQYVALQL
jgi:hypothetical protein